MNFDHLLRMSDSTGLLEHARGAVPRRAHGYCLDDVARGLVVLAREPDLPPELLRQLEVYLAFTAHAQQGSGAFHNRLSFDRRWIDTPSTGDWWGRAMWGLGTVAARIDRPWLRADALECFDAGARLRSHHPRAMAFAALGAAEILDRYPNHEAARTLLKDAVATIPRLGVDPAWSWPQLRLGYANAILAETLLIGGRYGHDDRLVEDGLRMLGWLLSTETHDDHLSVTPTGGWSRHEPRPAFDQQPIEVAALADACARAGAMTDDPRWSVGVARAVAWFDGKNDLGVRMSDPRTGGGFDGLGRTEASLNQGAESTLALLTTQQHGRDPI